MKITFVLPDASSTGGVRVVGIYADRLRRRGHEVFVASGPVSRRGRIEKLRELARGRWPRERDPRTPFIDAAGVPHRILEARRPVRDADLPDADVVVATWWETAYAVAALSPRKGRKVYFIQHHEVFDPLPSHMSRGSYYLPLKKITISRWLVEIMGEVYGDRDVDLVPNSVDMEQFNAPPRGRQARPTVGLLYSAVGFKGLEVSLAALARVRESVPDLQVVAFGRGPERRELPLPQGTRYFRDPPQDRLRDIYAMCDVWVCGSQAEGFGLPILEAMACRCPVVSTRIGGAIDLIEEGANGHIVPVDDAEALASKLIDTLRLSEPVWRRMSDAAHATAASYGWDDATTLFEGFLKAAAEAPRAEAVARQSG